MYKNSQPRIQKVRKDSGSSMSILDSKLKSEIPMSSDIYSFK